MRKAIFFDKDGTLISDIPYNTNTDKITFSEGADVAIKILSSLDFLFFVISNQAGVARGYMKEEEVITVGKKMHELFSNLHENLTGFYYCPHDINGIIEPYNVVCQCRKPKPGMILKAAREHSIDLGHSWMIGDILDDIEAGNRSCCRTILVNNGNETEWLKGKHRTPDFTVTNLQEAARIISTVIITEKRIEV